MVGTTTCYWNSTGINEVSLISQGASVYNLNFS
nr:MAG TPA: hypothetical protein [Caudoviricetes sp.]